MKRSPAEGLWWLLCGMLLTGVMGVVLMLLALVYLCYVIGGW